MLLSTKLGRVLQSGLYILDCCLKHTPQSPTYVQRHSNTLTQPTHLWGTNTNVQKAYFYATDRRKPGTLCRKTEMPAITVNRVWTKKSDRNVKYTSASCFYLMCISVVFNRLGVKYVLLNLGDAPSVGFLQRAL